MANPPINRTSNQPTSLTDRQLAGQRLMVGFDGTVFSEDLALLIGDLAVAGIILFSRNIESPAQVRELCHACREHARACGLPPLIVAVDQEGGPVARLRAPFTEFDGNAKMGGEDDAVRFAATTAKELLSVGINMNLAPVLDLAPAGVDSVMADRSFGADPGRVSQMGTAVIRHLQDAGVMAVAKHFPGIGRTTLDSHVDMPVLETPAELLEQSDLVPFRAAVDCGVAGVMFSHVRYPALDPEWPASLSGAVADRLLRREMGYGGVSMTDDLDMGAIGRHIALSTAVSRVMAAGVDLALICHRSPNIEAAHGQILAAIRSSDRIRRANERSVARVLALKKRYIHTGWEARRLGGQED
jgi:beta-N-acetylhexosaminidase